jgi:hypothetical protein
MPFLHVPQVPLVEDGQGRPPIAPQILWGKHGATRETPRLLRPFFLVMR